MRFRREAQLLAALNHPNIASIYGLDEAEGKPFLALELVDHRFGDPQLDVEESGVKTLRVDLANPALSQLLVGLLGPAALAVGIVREGADLLDFAGILSASTALAWPFSKVSSTTTS